MARKSRRTRRLRVVNPDCAGIDIGKDRHFVAVDPERSEEPVRSFGAFTRDLEEMAAWLASCGVTKVAMESTSVYWIPVYETLERAGFEVMLVPPRMTKQIGGRKSDVLDCQWIWQLMSYGLLRGAFRPGDEVCPLRSYARQMRRLTGDRSRCVLHMQKALTEMNVKLDSVIANITGLTGQRILRAIIGGERDPERLATLRHRGIKADADTIAASLQGTWREEHLFALEQAMQRYDFLTQQIDDCEARVMAEIERLTPPDDPPDGGAPDPAPGTISETASSRSANAATNDTGREGIQPLALRKMMGVDLTAIPTVGPGTALVIASEIGPDFSAFPSAQHFCSWLALAPGTRISGGKNLPGKSPKAVNPVGQALRMAAMAARRSETFIGAKHRARLARMDTPVAIKATARELACLVYLMVTEGQEYVEQGIGAYEKRRLNRKFAHLDRQARKLGLQLVPKMQGEEKQNPMLSIATCYSRASTCAALRLGRGSNGGLGTCYSRAWSDVTDGAGFPRPRSREWDFEHGSSPLATEMKPGRMFHGAQVSKNPAPQGGEPGLRRDRHRQGPAFRGGRGGTQRGAGAFVRRLYPRSGGDGGVAGVVRGVVKPPPARRSGSVAGVTGACVCDGWGLNWLRVG